MNSDLMIQDGPTQATAIDDAVRWVAVRDRRPLPKEVATAIDLVTVGVGPTSGALSVGAFQAATADPEGALRAGHEASGAAKPLTAGEMQVLVAAVMRVRQELERALRAPIVVPSGSDNRRVKRAHTPEVAIAPEVAWEIDQFVASKGEARAHRVADEGQESVVVASPWSASTQKAARALLYALARLMAVAFGATTVGLAELLLPNTIKAALERYERDGRGVRAEAAAHPGGRGVAFAGYAVRERLFMVLDVFLREHVRVWHPDVYAKVVEAGALEYYKAQRSVARRKAKVAVQLKPDVSRLDPWQLAGFAKDFWLSYEAALPARYVVAGISGRRLRRALLALALLAEAPIRMKNLIGLLVGVHLVFEGDRWWLRIPANELMNGGACQPGRPYTRRLSKPMSDVISRFIEEMKEVYGTDIFARVALLQSPEGSKEGRATSSSLGRDLSRLVEAKYGVTFSPHWVRDVVATHLIKWAPQRGLDGYGLAAEALGVDLKTVVAKYYSFSGTGLDAYTESLHEGDESGDGGDDEK